MAADVFTITGKIALDYSDAKSGLDNIKNSAGKAADSLEDVDDAAGDAGDSLEDAGDDAQSTDGKFSAWSVTLGSLAANAISTLISKCAELAGDIVDLGIDTETAFAKLETIAGTENIDALSDSISELSKETGVSSADLANVAYNAISAGASAEDAMDMVTAATKLGVAGFTDSESALSVLSTAMNSYGDSCGTVEEISDSLIMVQNLGVTTIDELSSTMGKAIATGSAYNVNLGNLESAYVSITKAGISTEEGTTYLNSMLNELGDSGSDVSAILQEQTGKSFTELMEDGYSLSDVLGILYDSCGEDSTALMNLWSSAEAGKASNAIVNQGLDEFNANLETITSSSGATESAYSTMADTTATKIEIMKANFQDLGLQIFNGLEGPLNSALTFVINTVIPGIQSFMDMISGIDFSPFIDGFTSIQEKIEPIITLLSEGIVDAVGSAIEWIQTDVAPVVEEIFGAISTFFTETFLPAVSGVWESIQSVISVVFGWLQSDVLPGIQSIMQAVGNAFSSAWELIQTVWNLAQPFFEAIWSVIKAIFSVVSPILSGFFSAAWEAIKAVWNVVTSFFQTIWNTIAGIFDVVKSVLSGDFSGAWDAIKGIFSGFADFFKTLWESVKKIFSAVGSFFSDIFSGAWKAIKNVFSGVGSFFSGIWDTISGIFSNIGNAIGNAVSNAFSSAVNWVLSTAIGIINGFIGAINTAIGIINNIPGVNINKLTKLEVPEMAEGGVLEKGQVGLLEGEGQEAVIPLEKNTGWIERTAASITKLLPQSNVGNVDLSDLLSSGALDTFATMLKTDVMNGVEDKLDEMKQLFNTFLEMVVEYYPQFASMEMVTDTDALVGEIAPKMNKELGRIATRKGRQKV